MIIILIGIPLFLIYSISSFHSLQGFTNERQLFAFSEETGNQSSVTTLNSKGMDFLTSGNYTDAITYFDKVFGY